VTNPTPLEQAAQRSAQIVSLFADEEAYILQRIGDNSPSEMHRIAEKYSERKFAVTDTRIINPPNAQPVQVDIKLAFKVEMSTIPEMVDYVEGAEVTNG